MYTRYYLNELRVWYYSVVEQNQKCEDAERSCFSNAFSVCAAKAEEETKEEVAFEAR